MFYIWLVGSWYIRRVILVAKISNTLLAKELSELKEYINYNTSYYIISTQGIEQREYFLCGCYTDKTFRSYATDSSKIIVADFLG